MSVGHYRLSEAAEPTAGEGSGGPGVGAVSYHAALGRDVAGCSHAKTGGGPQVSEGHC